jgi:hypothetical protein
VQLHFQHHKCGWGYNFALFVTGAPTICRNKANKSYDALIETLTFFRKFAITITNLEKSQAIERFLFRQVIAHRATVFILNITGKEVENVKMA